MGNRFTGPFLTARLSGGSSAGNRPEERKPWDGMESRFKSERGRGEKKGREASRRINKRETRADTKREMSGKGNKRQVRGRGGRGGRRGG